MTEAQRTSQSAAYESLKESIRRTYPHGWYVAIVQDRVVAASADFRELKRLVRAEGIEPRNALIVEVGANDPEFVNIFAVILD